MDRKKLLSIGAIMVLFIVGMVFLMNMGSSDPQDIDLSKSKNKEPFYTSAKWKKQAKLSNKDPYGLYVLEELLIADGRFTEFNEIINDNLLDSLVGLDSNLFMFLGNEFAITDDETDILLESIADGNEFFISAEKIPNYLYLELFERVQPTFFLKDSIIIQGKKDAYSMYNIYENDTLGKMWRVLDTTALRDFHKISSTIDDFPNYIDIQYGSGHIYFHTNPLCFSNFQLIRKEGFGNYQEVVEPFKHTKIQWLTFADYSFYPEEMEDGEGDGEKDDSLLQFIFRHQSLKWALVLALIGTILYFVFRSKREKPLVQQVAPKDNASMAYVDTIAGIYYSQKKPSLILTMIRKNFYLAVQKHFYIDLSKREDDKKLISLSEKSGIEKNKLQHLLDVIEEKQEIDYAYLTSTNKLVRKFYLKTGIWKAEEKKIIDEKLDVINRTILMPAALMIGSILLLVSAFILLSYSVGFGILFWPLGIAGCYIANKMFGKPLMKYNKEEIMFYPLFGKSSSFKRDDLIGAEINGNLVYFKFFGGEEIKLNIQNISNKDKSTLEQMVFSLNYNVYGR